MSRDSGKCGAIRTAHSLGRMIDMGEPSNRSAPSISFYRQKPAHKDSCTGSANGYQSHYSIWHGASEYEPDTAIHSRQLLDKLEHKDKFSFALSYRGRCPLRLYQPPLKSMAVEIDDYQLHSNCRYLYLRCPVQRILDIHLGAPL